LKHVVLSFAALSVLPVATAQTVWPDLFTSAVTPDFGIGQVVAFDKTFTTLDGTELLKIHFNGSAVAPEDRVKLLWIREDLKQDAGKILKGLQENEDDDIWCDGRADEIKGGVKLASETDTQAVYTYQPTDPDDQNTRKVMENSKAEITVEKASGQIKKAVITLQKPVKPLPVAKVVSFRMEAECEASSIGRPYLRRMSMDMELSIMFQKELDQNIQIIDNLTFPGLSTD
jgi:hypothetical protein